MTSYTLYENRLERIATQKVAPDLVQVIISREVAIAWLYQIASNLQYPDDGQPLIFAVFGELKVSDENEE